MKKYFNKILSVLFLLVLVLSINTNSFAYDYYILKEGQKIKITLGQEKRLLEYIKGDFYSESRKEKVRMLAPMYFMLSYEGNTSSLISCYSYEVNQCPISVEIAQMKERAEKNAHQDVNIIFIGNRFIVNNVNVRVNNTKEWDWLKKNYFEIIMQPKDHFYDRVVFAEMSSYD